MLVLPHHDGVAHEVLSVAEVLRVGPVFPQHPAHVAEPQAATGGVGILIVVVYVAMVTAMVRGPHQNAVLQSARTPQGEEQAHAPVRLIGLVGPETVVAAGDREPVEVQEQ